MTTTANPSWTQLLRNPSMLVAFGFGSGLAPRAPGTAGTLAAIPIYYFLRELTIGYYLGVLVTTFVIGIVICDVAARRLQVHDHSGIVWDEMVGYWLTMLLAPPQWWWMVVGFILFRIFDIAKPWPVGFVDKKLGGGIGIMLDDIVAAIYALLCLQLLAFGTIGYRVV